MKKLLALATIAALAAACGGTETTSPGTIEGEFYGSAIVEAFEAQSGAPACQPGETLKRRGTMLLNADGTGSIDFCRRCVTATGEGPATCDLAGAVAYKAIEGSHYDVTITPKSGPTIDLRMRHAGDWVLSDWIELPGGHVADYLETFRCPGDNCDGYPR